MIVARIDTSRDLNAKQPFKLVVEIERLYTTEESAKQDLLRLIKTMDFI